MRNINYKSIKKEVKQKPDKKGGYIRDFGIAPYISTETKRKEFGAHLTSIDIFKKFIFPEIKGVLHKYSWIDLFAGEGNLILPILELIPKNKRVDFFKDHIFLFDIQKEMVEKSIRKAKNYGIPICLKGNLRKKYGRQE